MVTEKDQEGWAAGRYPVKAAEQVLKVLENAEANAEYKGMDTENLFIEHISSLMGSCYFLELFQEHSVG